MSEENAKRMILEMRCCCGAYFALDCPAPAYWAHADKYVDLAQAWTAAHGHAAPKLETKDA